MSPKAKVERRKGKMGERIKGELVEIDINKKYAILVREKMTEEQYYRLLDNLQRFIKSDNPFIVIDGTYVELVDLSENE